MKKIGMGLIGPGFVAAHHIDAVRRLGDVEVVAIAGSSQQSADRKAREYKVDRAYGDFHALIADPDVQVIHNTTPNYLHLPITMAAIKAGNAARFAETYAQLTATCNACHQATDHSAVVIQAPKASPYPDQDFGPAKP